MVTAAKLVLMAMSSSWRTIPSNLWASWQVKAYNTVTIWGRANARAYAVKAEDLVGEAAVEGQYNVDYSVDPVGAAAIKGASYRKRGRDPVAAVDPQSGL